MSMVFRRRRFPLCVLLMVISGVGLLFAFAANAQSDAAQPSSTPVTGAVQAETLFADWDKDQNKALSLVEFKAGLQAVQTAAALRELRTNFVAKDTNKDGVLDAAEYANLTLIKSAGASALPFSTFDTDKSQRLDFKEYVAMISVLIKTKP